MTGQKLSLKLAYADVEPLLLAKARISRALRHRDRRVKVTYKIANPEEDDAALPMERMLERIGG